MGRLEEVAAVDCESIPGHRYQFENSLMDFDGSERRSKLVIWITDHSIFTTLRVLHFTISFSDRPYHVSL